MRSYFKFLQISPFDDAIIFKRAFIENEAKGTLRLCAMANAIVMRRTVRYDFFHLIF